MRLAQSRRRLLPHHTQAITLLAMLEFQEVRSSKEALAIQARSLIARVGTGEGKSLLVALLTVMVQKR